MSHWVINSQIYAWEVLNLPDRCWRSWRTTNLQKATSLHCHRQHEAPTSPSTGPVQPEAGLVVPCCTPKIVSWKPIHKWTSTSLIFFEKRSIWAIVSMLIGSLKQTYWLVVGDDGSSQLVRKHWIRDEILTTKQSKIIQLTLGFWLLNRKFESWMQCLWLGAPDGQEYQPKIVCITVSHMAIGLHYSWMPSVSFSDDWPTEQSIRTTAERVLSAGRHCWFSKIPTDSHHLPSMYVCVL